MTTTNAKAWRKGREEGVEITFNVSKMTAQIRPIDIGFYVLHQSIPDVLGGIIYPLIDENKIHVLPTPTVDSDAKRKDWLKFLEELTVFAFIEPKVRPYEESGSEPLGDDEISVEDIPYLDKVQLYRFLSLPAQSLSGFRQEQIKSLGVLATTAGNTSASQPDTQDQPMGISANGNAG
jgi:hypothetical protein